MKINTIAKILGKRGGKARAKKLSPQERKLIAAQGGHARSASYLAKRSIEENFRYLEFLKEFFPKTKVSRVAKVNSRLPGIYSSS